MPSIYDHETTGPSEEESKIQKDLYMQQRDLYMQQMKDLMIAPIYNNPIYNAQESVEEVRFNSAERAMYAMSKISLLHGMKRLTDKEAARLVSLMDSTDEENWTVAEECINQKFSEI